MKKENPVIWSDYPDPDIIRVEDTYYMISTTMHMMPGGVVLRSYDLLHWEIASYVFAALDHTPGQRLCDGIGIYGKGMWAASLMLFADFRGSCQYQRDRRFYNFFELLGYQNQHHINHR